MVGRVAPRFVDQDPDGVCPHQVGVNRGRGGLPAAKDPPRQRGAREEDRGGQGGAQHDRRAEGDRRRDSPGSAPEGVAGHEGRCVDAHGEGPVVGVLGIASEPPQAEDGGQGGDPSGRRPGHDQMRRREGPRRADHTDEVADVQ